MTNLRTEAQVKLAVQEYLTRFGHTWFRMNTGGLRVGKRFIRFGTPGMADILVLLPPNGYALWIEVKRPLGPKGGTHGSEQSPEQEVFALAVACVGAGYRLVRSLDDLIVALREETATAKTATALRLLLAEALASRAYIDGERGSVGASERWTAMLAARAATDKARIRAALAAKERKP